MDDLEAVILGRTDNTMDKRKTMDNKILHRKDRATRIHRNRGELMCSGRVSSSCSTCGTRRVTKSVNYSCVHTGIYN